MSTGLRRTAAQARRPGPAREAAIAAGTAVTALGLLAAGPGVVERLPGIPGWAVAACQLAAAAALLCRRRAPLTVALLTAALSVPATALAAVPAGYAAVAYGIGRVRTGLAVAVVSTVVARPWGWALTRVGRAAPAGGDARGLAAGRSRPAGRVRAAWR